jgi:hypothetical protein
MVLTTPKERNLTCDPSMSASVVIYVLVSLLPPNLIIVLQASRLVSFCLLERSEVIESRIYRKYQPSFAAQ